MKQYMVVIAVMVAAIALFVAEFAIKAFSALQGGMG